MNKLANAIMGYGGASGGAGKGTTPTSLAANAPAASMPTTAPAAKGLGPVSGSPPVPPASPRPPSPTAPAGEMITPAANLPKPVTPSTASGPPSGTPGSKMTFASLKEAQEAARAVLASCDDEDEDDMTSGEGERPDNSPSEAEESGEPPSPTVSTTPQMAQRNVTAAEQLRESLLRSEMPASMRPIEPPKPPKPPKPFKPQKPGTTKDFRLGSTAGTI